NRRGLVTSSQSTESAGAQNATLKKTSEAAVKSAWLPDPETGFYRPENYAKEMDPVELRALLIKNNN
ncbi:hypothetical protein M569_14625, partial [Genlisea aurea]